MSNSHVCLEGKLAVTHTRGRPEAEKRHTRGRKGACQEWLGPSEVKVSGLWRGLHTAHHLGALVATFQLKVMTAMQIDTDFSTVLANLRLETENPQITEILYQLEDYYERRLWNQLTLCLEELFQNPESAANNLRFKIFNNFISKFQDKLNSISVIDFLLQSFENSGDCYDNLNDLKTSLIEQLTKQLSSRRLEKLDEVLSNDEAIVYINLQIARHALLLHKLAQADEILESINDKFDSTLQNDYSSKINAAYYLTKCQQYKLAENYNLFYTNGLLYLSLINTPMTREQQVAFCHDLCIAALLGDKIYNFGELILHEILTCIAEPAGDYYWLYELIHHLNSGNLAKFHQVLSSALIKSPQLAHHQDFLKQKIVIMALLESVSLKPTTNKRLLFSEISDVTKTPLDQVEFVIIKCFSLGLIKGFINQIDQVLVVTWLQPRILNLDQVETLYHHLVDWDKKVEALSHQVHANGGTIWAGV